ncbi:MAG: MFS transporter [Fusobacteriaceae bacterium]
MNINFFKMENYSKTIRTIFLINFISVLAFQGIFSIFTGIHVKNLGYGEGSFGTLLSFNNIFIAVGSLSSAFFIKQFNFKKTLAFGFLSLGLGILGLGLSNNFDFLIFFSSLIGFGYSIPLTSISVLLNDHAPPEKKVQIFSTNFVLQNIGVIIGSYSAGSIIKFLSFFIEERNIIPTIYILTFITIFIGFLPISKLNLHYEKTTNLSSNFYIDLKRIFKGKSLEFLKYNTLIGFGAGLVVPFFSIYLKFALNIDSNKVGSIMAISQFGLVIGGLLVPHISKKFGKEFTVILCQVLSVPFLLSITSFSNISIVTFCFFMRSTLMNLNQPLIQNISMECVDRELRPLFSSFVSISSYLTRSVSVILAGYIMERISYNLPYYITVIFYLLGTYTFWKAFSKKKIKKV